MLHQCPGYAKPKAPASQGRVANVSLASKKQRVRQYMHSPSATLPLRPKPHLHIYLLSATCLSADIYAIKIQIYFKGDKRTRNPKLPSAFANSSAAPDARLKWRLIRGIGCALSSCACNIFWQITTCLRASVLHKKSAGTSEDAYQCCEEASSFHQSRPRPRDFPGPADLPLGPLPGEDALLPAVLDGQPLAKARK